MHNVVRYGKNILDGNDYLVGDIHGCFTKLYEELDKIGFDYDRDRLFCVGDYVDRGPESKEVIDFLAKPWVFGVMGNHEQMAIDYAAGFAQMDMYLQNGGEWFIKLPNSEQQMIAKVFAELPIIIELETANGIVGIVHAECIDDDWNKTKEWIVKQPHVASNVLLWGRDKINYKNKDPVVGIHAVVVGHTPRNAPEVLGNVHYIDTGAVYGSRGCFTIINAETLQKVN